MKTGVIGLGAMGASMARNLHRVGLLAGVWNRTPEKAHGLGRELGVHVAADPAELAGRCELLILSVSADADLLEVVTALKGGLRPGSVVADSWGW